MGVWIVIWGLWACCAYQPGLLIFLEQNSAAGVQAQRVEWGWIWLSSGEVRATQGERQDIWAGQKGKSSQETTGRYWERKDINELEVSIRSNNCNEESVCPGRCGCVDWVTAWEQKDQWFDSQSEHIPRLGAKSRVEGTWETTNRCFSCTSLFSSLSSPLSKN